MADKQYRITWTIDEYAESPKEAVKTAMNHLVAYPVTCWQFEAAEVGDGGKICKPVTVEGREV